MKKWCNAGIYLGTGMALVGVVLAAVAFFANGAWVHVDSPHNIFYGWHLTAHWWGSVISLGGMFVALASWGAHDAL